MGRQAAHRIGGGRIASEKRSLATTTPEIDMAFGAFTARQWHPGLTSETVEAGRLMPNGFEGLLPDIFKLKVGNSGGVRTG